MLEERELPEASVQAAQVPGSRRFERPRRGVVLASVGIFAVAAAGGVGAVIMAKDHSATTFTAVVQPTSQVGLAFAETAPLASLDVQPGQVVRAGQVLATQSSAQLHERVVEDQALVALDRAQLALIEASPAGAATQKASVQVTQSQHSLASAQQQATDAQSVGQADVAKDQAALSAAQSVVTQDQATFSTNCPSGVVVPPGYASVAGGAAPAAGTVAPSPQQVQTYLNCVSLSTSISSAQGQVSAAQAALVAAQQQAHQTSDAASAAVSAAQGQVSVSQAGVSSSSAIAAQLAAAKAQLARDQAQLAIDQAALDQVVLRAPISGVVASVSVAVGELVGPSGQRSDASSSDPFPASSGVSLFPVAPSSQANTQSSSSGPAITLDATSGWRFLAQVPQGPAAKLVSGTAMSVTLDSSGAVLHGRVVAVEPNPIVVSGATYYAVVIGPASGSPRQLPAGTLPGMTATAVVHP